MFVGTPALAGTAEKTSKLAAMTATASARARQHVRPALIKLVLVVIGSPRFVLLGLRPKAPFEPLERDRDSRGVRKSALMQAGPEDE
jgi:hypothetical protein